MKTRKSGFTQFSEEKGVFETENPVFRVHQEHGSHPYYQFSLSVLLFLSSFYGWDYHMPRNLIG